jgi:diamine N-acetyltransferase
MYVMWEPGEDGPEGFYRKLGFQLTGEKRGGQTIGMLDLTPLRNGEHRGHSQQGARSF